MIFDLCIGGGEFFWEFPDTEARDKVWDDLTSSPEWENSWAEKSGWRRIVLRPELMPMTYRWKCTFRS